MAGMMQDQVLLQSNVGARIWALYHSDPDAFRQEVKDYFAKALPGWKVKKAVYGKREIWLVKGRE